MIGSFANSVSRKEVAAMDMSFFMSHSIRKYQHLQTTSGTKPT